MFKGAGIDIVFTYLNISHITLATVSSSALNTSIGLPQVL